MSSNTVLSDVLSALHSTFAPRNPRRPGSIRESLLRRKNSTGSAASSVDSDSGSVASKRSRFSLRRKKKQDIEQPQNEKGKQVKGKQPQDKSSTESSDSHHPYFVYRQESQSQAMIASVLRDPDTIRQVLDAILDSPGGKRSLSRLARTCKALSEPALNTLWRDLDSIVPLIGLFPPHLLRRPKKPGLGFAKMPLEDDWKKVLRYGEKVRGLTYNESSNNVSSPIFAVLEEYRPRTYILPHLSSLTWKVETPAGLDRCSLFLSPKVQGLTLEIGTRFPQLDSFLTDMCSRTRLTSFSFISPTTLPDAFVELLLPQTTLERLTLVAPGALSPGVGRWIASLPQLTNLQLDMTGRSMIAVEGFFDELRPRSGDSTPSSVGSTDSGVFSEDELDFSEIRKSALRLTGDLRSKGSFAKVHQLNLTGEVSNIAVFLKHLTSRLTQLELVIEDPPDKADWQDMCGILCDKFDDSLQSLKITATSASRFSELVRSTARLEPSSHLSLEHLKSLKNLRRMEIDLPESTIFHAADIAHLAAACPSLEELRLCPVARFPIQGGPPKLTLENLGPLLGACKRLHTLSIAVNGQNGSDKILSSTSSSSPSLQRLHIGYSWVQDPLQVSILLSHIAPTLESLRWFHERNRPGYIEANANGWQKVSEALPHIQNVRKFERTAAAARSKQPVKPETAEKSVDASVHIVYANRAISAKPQMADSAVQISPSLISRMVEAKVEAVETSVDATQLTAEIAVQASPTTTEQTVDAVPLTVSTQVDASAFSLSKAVEAMVPASESHKDNAPPATPPKFTILPIVFDAFCYATSALIYYPLLIPLRILDLSLKAMNKENDGEKRDPSSSEKYASMNSVSSAGVGSNGRVHFGAEANKYDHDYAHERQRQAEDEVQVARWIPKRKVGQTDGNRSGGTRQISGTVHKSYKYPMADNRKQEKDFTQEVDAILPQADALAKAGKLQEAVDKLSVLEKQTRNAADLSSTTRLVTTIAEHCYTARDYALLNSSVSVLSKKHGQLKGAVQAMVEKVMGWLEEVKERDGVDKWLEILETLRGVTEGKIFLETPRARVTLLLSHYHEGLANSAKATPENAKQSLRTASELLSELQVETYSSMERREKTEFILEQMRLLIAVARQKDAEADKEGKDSLSGGEAEWIKVRVGGRKINETFLAEKDNEDLKLKYYDLMIQYALQQSQYLDVAKYYYKVWETPSIKEDVGNKGKMALQHISYYIVLSPHNNEQAGMLHALYNDPALKPLELHYNLVKSFHTHELMRWPGVEALYGQFLRQTPVFSNEKRWEDLHTRVIEHNIRVVAVYYSRITISRLMALLDLTLPQTEETLSRLVVSGTIWAKTDRPAGIISFRSKQTPEDVMNDWSSDMQKLLGLVEKTWMGMNAAQAAQSRVKPSAS
ncbi:hypothetical protein HGRIS_008145 [Hohenbuehelia grisea]|uniref:PCI domain-containing protein n=1 Tax=Hohenbuehelia grisea TaxID=104357 RepID=A0ABR3J7G3_9AGAR